MCNNYILTLFALFDYDTPCQALPFDIEASETVGHLKERIKDANPNSLRDLDAQIIQFCRVSNVIPKHLVPMEKAVTLDDLQTKAFLSPTRAIADVVGTNNTFEKIAQVMSFLLPQVLNLFTFIAGEATTNAFPGNRGLQDCRHLKDLILSKNSYYLREIDARQLRRWRV
ncbi:hypothetical protein BGZ96_012195 [Linnemannia gamsii]|uniref:Crinkler effector protein N-terminal domain-containing protein n=1 Tax=Linnemannia gamsii TaxID=64522 RepID=A0ABQ7JRT6_9FUNG|nr:hypothetical protein BGZ96_012195 [Linnemannia gamsii]